MVALFRNLAPAPSAADPSADRIESGSPKAFVRVFHETPDGRVSAGTWTCSPGRWRVIYEEVEYCRITEGRGALIDADGGSTLLQPGDEFVVPAGFRGVWEVTEIMTKTWVVMLP